MNLRNAIKNRESMDMVKVAGIPFSHPGTFGTGKQSKVAQSIRCLRNGVRVMVWPIDSTVYLNRICTCSCVMG
jgi:hypothetical protein